MLPVGVCERAAEAEFIVLLYGASQLLANLRAHL